MRRKQGNLVPLEKEILGLGADGKPFYGYDLNKSKSSTGAVYRALQRLEKMGYLISSWEDLKPWPLLSENLKDEHRIRRRYYKLTDKALEYLSKATV